MTAKSTAGGETMDPAPCAGITAAPVPARAGESTAARRDSRFRTPRRTVGAARWPTYPYIAATGPGGGGETNPSATPRRWCPSRTTTPSPTTSRTEADDEPDDETDDETDEERDDEPESGTLYFGERLMDGPILLKPSITPQPPGGAATAGPAGSIPLSQGQCPRTAPAPVQRCVGAPKVCLQGSLYPEAPFLRGG